MLISRIRHESGYSTDGSESSGTDFYLNDNLEETLKSSQPDFGILFDVDGVLARGTNPLEPAVKALKLLQDEEGNLKVPVAFVTNACNRSEDKARQISKWFNVQVLPDMVIHAPTPAKLLTEFHDKHVLVIGQEHRRDIALDIGFTKVCTIEDIQKAYPFLDMVDHDNRKRLAAGTYHDDPSFPRVEAILMIGEPKLWETNLQLLIDLLLTEGKPTRAPSSIMGVKPLPIIACNMDLVFMDRACMPRFGHGSFLLCLESLYKKITGRELDYTALIGKPCEITYRYAEHCIADVAQKLGIQNPIKKLYFIGDNPSVDIVGANLYHRFLRRQSECIDNEEVNYLPRSRSIPNNSHLYQQTVLAMESLLVGTGVYKPEEEESSDDDVDIYHGHRDIENEPELAKPSKFVIDVYHGIRHILDKENFSVKT